MSIDTAATLRGLDRAAKQISFGVARGLTRTAQAAAKQVTADMPKRFDRPTPFTRAGVSQIAAKPVELVAYVFVKDLQAEYLLLEETGGTRRRVPGKPVTLPATIRVNAYGNIPRGAIGKLRASDDVFFADGRTNETRHLSPGLYQRPKRGKRRLRNGGNIGTKGALRFGGAGKAVGGAKAKGATTLRLLVALGRQATYKPRFQFRQTVVETARRAARDTIAASIAEALSPRP